jgi:hypothetical protein
MELVYNFIGEFGTTPFEIPKMRFVQSALVVAEGGHDTYMVEEVIDEAVDGKFVKYIGNSSAVPNEFEHDELADRAAFLAFCQHVQYWKTQEMAFIGDFQGNVMVYSARNGLVSQPVTDQVDALCSQTLKSSRLRLYASIFHSIFV